MDAQPGNFKEGSLSTFSSVLLNVPSDSVRSGVNHVHNEERS